MPGIEQVVLEGIQGGANGDLTGIQFSIRVFDCDLIRVELSLTETESAPIFVIDPLTLDTNNFATTLLPVSEANNLSCGSKIFIKVFCAGELFFDRELIVTCKEDNPSVCPSGGPQLTVVPELPDTDCITAGNYTLTVPGTWPDGTGFFWQIATVPGQFIVTGQTGPTYTHAVSSGDAEVELLVTIVVVNCPPVSSSVTLPAVVSISCPTSVTLNFTASDGTVITVGFPPFGPPQDITGVQPDTYLIEIAAPNSAALIWVIDGQQQSTATQFSITLQPNTSRFIQVSVATPCCTTLWPSLFLRAADGPEVPVVDVTDPTEDPIERPPPPPFWCPWICRIVTIGLVLFLISLVITVAATPFGLALLPSLAAVLPAIAFAVLLLMICNQNLCGLLQRIVWSLKWAVVVGLVIALLALSAAALVFVFALGILTGLLLVWMSNIRCADPPMNRLVC